MTLDVRRRRDRKRARRLRVFLNGAEVKDCYYADGRRGVVRRYVRDRQGRRVLLRWRDRFGSHTRVQTEELRGSIAWRPV